LGIAGVVAGASEQRSLERSSESYRIEALHARAVIDRIKAVHPLAPSAFILDVGAAQGLFVLSCAEMGYRCIGVEPWPDARLAAEQIARLRGRDTTIVDGTAESLPFEDETFDFVHAKSVVEHVDDAEATFREVYRVLKPGGVFWFLTASAMCPRQSEIRGFPGFGWYPDRWKIRIMEWAKDHRPEAVGHTIRPAYHWFTPWKARRMLREAGFTSVLDRWDLRLAGEGGLFYRTLLGVIRSGIVTKTIADVVVPTCSYAAFK
jgi:ubiquinone/menaquinone biosynthesis C-methylase UbiE